MAKEIIDGKQNNIKIRQRYPKMVFDKLKMYFGEPLVIDIPNTAGSITAYQPTIGDILNIGEDKFFNTLAIIISNTTQFRLALWKAKLDWNEISDFEMFILYYKLIDKDCSKLLFGNLSWGDFEPFSKKGKEKDELVLYNKKDDIEIDELVYQNFHQFYQNVFNIFPEEKITHDTILKRWYISKDERDQKNREEMNIKDSFSIQPIVSSCVNHAGFKYKLKELKEVGVCEFYDSVQRLQIYESTTALLKGMYSGFVDTSKIPSSDFNWMREI